MSRTICAHILANCNYFTEQKQSCSTTSKILNLESIREYDEKVFTENLNEEIQEITKSRNINRHKKMNFSPG